VKSAAEMVLSHLGQASNAKFPVDQVEERRHHRTPLFDPPTILAGDRFQPSSLLGKNGFVGGENCFLGPVEETASRFCEDGQAGRNVLVANIGPDPGRIAKRRMLPSAP
jgi:hypothetical protein